MRIIECTCFISGVRQGHNQASGDLGTIQTVGNLRRIRLKANRQSGKWQININSAQPYTLKITGEIGWSLLLQELANKADITLFNTMINISLKHL